MIMADEDYIIYQNVRDIIKLDISDLPDAILDKHIVRAVNEVSSILKTAINKTTDGVPSFTDTEFNSRDLMSGNYGSILYFNQFEDYGNLLSITAVSYRSIDSDSYTLQTEGMNYDYVVDERISAIKFMFYLSGAGSKNVKVSGTYGYTTDTLPDWLKEWIELIAALQGIVYASGGSYDNVKTYTIGNVSNSKGEYASNLNAQYKIVKELLDNHMASHGVVRGRTQTTLA